MQCAASTACLRRGIHPLLHSNLALHHIAVLGDRYETTADMNSKETDVTVRYCAHTTSPHGTAVCI